MRAGRWQAARQFCFFDHPIRDLAGFTLGVIGDGVLGQAVADIGRALGMRVLMSAFKGRCDQGTLYTQYAVRSRVGRIRHPDAALPAVAGDAKHDC